MWKVSTGSGNEPSQTEIAGPASTSRSPPTTDSPMQPISRLRRCHLAHDVENLGGPRGVVGRREDGGEASPALRPARSPPPRDASVAAARASSAVDKPAPVFMAPECTIGAWPNPAAPRTADRRTPTPPRAAAERPRGRVLLSASRPRDRRALHAVRAADLHGLHAARGGRLPVPRVPAGVREVSPPVAPRAGDRARPGRSRGSSSGFNLAVFVLEIATGGRLGFDLSGAFNSKLIAWGGLQPLEIALKGEYYRLITATFLHGGLLHVCAQHVRAVDPRLDDRAGPGVGAVRAPSTSSPG